MKLYIKLLIQSNTVKFISTIIFLVVSSLIFSLSVSDFINDSEGLPNIFIIGISQILFVVQYILLRLMWKIQILDANNDCFSTFICDKNQIIKLVKFKIVAFLSVVLLHIIFSYVFFFLFNGLSLNYVFLLAGLAGALLMCFIYFFDILTVNGISNVIKEILITVVFILLLCLFWYPSEKLLFLTLGVFLIITVINILLLRGNYNVKNN